MLIFLSVKNILTFGLATFGFNLGNINNPFVLNNKITMLYENDKNDKFSSVV